MLRPIRISKMLAILPLVYTGMAVRSFADNPQPLAKSGTKDALFLTITNGTSNSLVVINTRTKQTAFVPTGGIGGASGNAGGVAVDGKLVAAINFGSSSVSIFVRKGDAMQPTQVIKTASQPVSVTFGQNHLVVLGLTTAESFPVFGDDVGTAADGSVSLARGDKTAAQITFYDGGVMYTEKSGSVAGLSMSANGAPGLTGPNDVIQLPAAPNNDTPFGIAGRGANVYLSIAHSNLSEVLVVGNRIVTSTAGPSPQKDASGNLLHAPCWNALSGQFMFASDSPGKQVIRYLVSDNGIYLDKLALAKLGGSPTDLAADGDLLGVIDGGDGVTSNVSIFHLDTEGELTPAIAMPVSGPINGAAIIR
ncbi:MAG TPA: hypothetical protein VKU19_04410 [Bryobacteraceae bacterium]|nr:hypothetical protein [Bryobacteraceae bacterium]